MQRLQLFEFAKWRAFACIWNVNMCLRIHIYIYIYICTCTCVCMNMYLLYINLFSYIYMCVGFHLYTMYIYISLGSHKQAWVSGRPPGEHILLDGLLPRGVHHLQLLASPQQALDKGRNDRVDLLCLACGCCRRSIPPLPAFHCIFSSICTHCRGLPEVHASCLDHFTPPFRLTVHIPWQLHALPGTPRGACCLLRMRKNAGR